MKKQMSEDSYQLKVVLPKNRTSKAKETRGQKIVLANNYASEETNNRRIVQIKNRSSEES